MFPCDIIFAENPPPTMKTTRQACCKSLYMKGGDKSLPSDIYREQYLCQIVIITKFYLESDRYSEKSWFTGLLKCEKISLIVW